MELNTRKLTEQDSATDLDETHSAVDFHGPNGLAVRLSVYVSESGFRNFYADKADFQGLTLLQVSSLLGRIRAFAEDNGLLEDVPLLEHKECLS